jgi:protein SDA1
VPLVRPRTQGTRSSKRKKQAKIKRALHTVKKAAKRGEESTSESFAALHLLHDPQVRLYTASLG